MDSEIMFLVFDSLRRDFGLTVEEAVTLLNEGLDRADATIAAYTITDKAREMLGGGK